MPKMARDEITLTPEQRALVEEFYYLNIRELIRKVFNNDELTLRCDPEVKAVKQALADLGKKPNPVPTVKEQELLNVLTEEQKEYIRNNYRDSSPLEMTRLLFDNPKLEGFSKQCKVVMTYCKQLDPKYIKEEEIAEDGPYEPPKGIIQVLGKANRYAMNTRGDGKALFDPATLSNAQKHQLETLLAYMQLPLFKVEANKFNKKVDREVFESVFIANCWDKPDLTAAQVIQFIQLASLLVKGNQLDRIAQKLDDRQNDNLSDPDSPIKMTEVETLNAYREKINAGAKQIAALIKTLEGDRAKTMEAKHASNASMHNLVESWRREDSRKKIIQLAERQQKAALKKEIERFSTMSSLKSEIFGLNQDDLLK